MHASRQSICWGASTHTIAANEAFDIVNGDVFRWRWMWSRLAGWFGLDAAAFDGTIEPVESQMAVDADI